MAAMKLYYSPGSCSLAAHIVLEEAGLKYDIERVNTKDHVTETGADYFKVNPNGYVPALQLDDGAVLHENSALLPWIAQQSKGAKLIPADGTMENYRVREWLGFLSSELHKNYSPLFRGNLTEELVKFQLELIARRLGSVEQALQGRSYLTGEAFTPADAYLFVILRWSPRVNVALEGFPNLQAFQARVGARPAVVAAMKAQGLIKG
ncbi:MAG TPA: glutathione transferase GstA [Steroidobacteraceae bacterium]|nr:glutathione transferase GstA [Steroidobacteraceae bacterium]